ncbi:MAG: glycosyltransferase family 39 protein [Verrucomicrobiae bacterium]|nr:glycosyltransferase family 39 protein [Verrucomicrobiae bacterium]
MPVNPAQFNGATGMFSRGTRVALALFLAYAAAQALLRVAVSESLELDEAEQVLLAQHWAWGYGGQPPLYTWLQAALFAALGTNVAAVALLKALLVFAVLGLTYRAVREITDSETIAFAAAAAWFLLPHFAWEARRDLSHTVLALVAVVAVIFFAARWHKRPGVTASLGLGMSAAVGVLSKYNFLLFVAAFGLAALSLRPMRASLRDARLLPGLILFLGITGAHGAWFVTHLELATSGHQKLLVPDAAGRVQASLLGLASLLVQGAPALLLLAAVCWACSLRRAIPGVPTPAASLWQSLLARTLIFGVALCGVLAIVMQMRFKARWLLPLFGVAPLYAALWVHRRAGERRVQWLARAGSATALVMLFALPAATLLASITGKLRRHNAPYAALINQVKPHAASPDLILAGNRLVGGNVKLFYPASRVVVPELAAPPIPNWSRCLVVWDATRQAEMPPALSALVSRFCNVGATAFQPQYVEATQKYTRTRTMRLGLVVLSADCTQVR